MNKLRTENIDLVLLDITLPDGTDLSCAEHFAKKRKSTLSLSGSGFACRCHKRYCDESRIRNRSFCSGIPIFTIAASVAASFISTWAVLLAVVICTTSVLLFLLFTRSRYQAISNLSVQVDSILHGEYNVNLIPDEEGEIAVLGSELSKMTLRLRDQAGRLEKDKRYLSDSLADISHRPLYPCTGYNHYLISPISSVQYLPIRCIQLVYLFF